MCLCVVVRRTRKTRISNCKSIAHMSVSRFNHICPGNCSFISSKHICACVRVMVSLSATKRAKRSYASYHKEDQPTALSVAVANGEMYNLNDVLKKNSAPLEKR